MRTIIFCLFSSALLMAFVGCKGPKADPYDGDMSGIDLLDTDILGMGGPLPPRGDDMFSPDRMVPGVQFDTVQFGYDSAQIAASEQGKLEVVADAMRSQPGTTLVVDGHCDERGSREYNLSLGERRALAARAYLVGLGIDGSRLHTRSFGEENPIDPGHSESAWRMNRRAEFSLYR